jgi:serine/threonine-protein kinase
MGGDDVNARTILSSSQLQMAERTRQEGEVREGDTLGSYQLERLLGEGSMGRVFQARHARLGRQVALKVLRPDFARDASYVQRFFQEARAVNQINHEHIVEIFDFVEDGPGGHVYCVMELLRGQSLAELLQEEKLSLLRIRRIAVQLCAALGAAHQLGVVHRDIKPDNIFITQRPGQPDFVKVLDFGVAKMMSTEVPTTTLDGSIIGTPLYMSPEQAAGLPVDHRADIYAVGAVLYEMLSGRPPLEADSFGKLMVKVITEPPPPLPRHLSLDEPLPPALEALTLRCLAKEPEKRPQQLAEVVTALLLDAPPLGTEVEAQRPTQPMPVAPDSARSQGARRHRTLVAAVGGLLLVAGGLLVGLGAQVEAPAPAEMPAVARAEVPEPPPAPPTLDSVKPARPAGRQDTGAVRDAPLNPMPPAKSRKATAGAQRPPSRAQPAGTRDAVLDPFAP